MYAVQITNANGDNVTNPSQLFEVPGTWEPQTNNIMSQAWQYTDQKFYTTGTFSGSAGGTSHDMTLIGDFAGNTNDFGYYDSSGSFNSLVYSETTAVGGSIPTVN